MTKTRQLNFRPSARALAAIEYLTGATGLNQTQVIERALIAAEKRHRKRTAEKGTMMVELTAYGMELMGADTRIVQLDVVNAVLMNADSSADGETVAEWDGDTVYYRQQVAGRRVR